MRLPLRHKPRGEDAPLKRCAHLEALADAAIGLPLGPAASLVASDGGRGRHGRALEWHLGLAGRDSDAALDWEGRIEIKLVSVWRRASGRLTSDKLKVCDAAIDPWEKLSNVLFVLADRLSRVVLGYSFFSLKGPPRISLEASWQADPHFEHPALFVEAREGSSGAAPAYYASARWLVQSGIVPDDAGPLGHAFDSNVWARLRRDHNGRDPLLTVARAGEAGVRCPRCRGRIEYDAATLMDRSWTVAHHTMPIEGPCALRGHVAIDARRLPSPAGCSAQELRAGIEGTPVRESLWRLADRVPEPEDHLH